MTSPRSRRPRTVLAAFAAFTFASSVFVGACTSSSAAEALQPIARPGSTSAAPGATLPVLTASPETTARHHGAASSPTEPPPATEPPSSEAPETQAPPSEPPPSAEPSSKPPSTHEPSSQPPPSVEPARDGIYFTHGSRARKWIAFTFDADMKDYMWQSRSRTDWKDPRIIRLLRDTNTPATIFLNGLFVKAYPAFVKDIASDDLFELANHTWDHLGWTNPCFSIDHVRPPMTKRMELTMTEDIVKRVTGKTLEYFRFPAGCHTTADLRLVHRLGETSIGWDTYLGDALGWTPAHMVRYAKQVARNGSIMVMHLNGAPYHPGTYEALTKLIPWFKDHGWKFVTVGQMLGGG